MMCIGLLLNFSRTAAVTGKEYGRSDHSDHRLNRWDIVLPGFGRGANSCGAKAPVSVVSSVRSTVSEAKLGQTGRGWGVPGSARARRRARARPAVPWAALWGLSRGGGAPGGCSWLGPIVKGLPARRRGSVFGAYASFLFFPSAGGGQAFRRSHRGARAKIAMPGLRPTACWAKLAKPVFLSLPDVTGAFDAKMSQLTGNPVREAIVESGKKTLLASRYPAVYWSWGGRPGGEKPYNSVILAQPGTAGRRPGSNIPASRPAHFDLERVACRVSGRHGVSTALGRDAPYYRCCWPAAYQWGPIWCCAGPGATSVPNWP